jgi:N-methylhydantoinase B
VLAGQVVRVVTTGGGGWGDPLEREPELVARDVTEGRVSQQAARDDYGVVLRTGASPAGYDLDMAATAKLRSDLRAQRATLPPMIDRGPGYERMARGECAPRMHSKI